MSNYYYLHRRKTNSEFSEEVFKLFGDEYSIVGEYITRTTPILMRHNICGHEWNVRPHHFLNGRLCNKCRDEQKAKAKDDTYKQKLLDINAQIINIESFINNKTEIKHKCLLCSNVFSISPELVLYNPNRCTMCYPKYELSAKQIKRGSYTINKITLWETNPEIAALLKNPDIGHRVTRSTRQIETFVCDKCHMEIEAYIDNVVRYKLVCRSCSDGISYNNRLLYNIFKSINVDFISEKAFSWSRRKLYDFYIKDMNIIVELHGKQHYENLNNDWFEGSLEERQKIDQLKYDLAVSNGIDKYIVIDCSSESSEIIKENIVKSELSNIFNFSNIDWELIESQSCKSFVHVCAELWNNGLAVHEIHNETKLACNTICRYLKTSTKLKLCDYTVESSRSRSKETRCSTGKSVICLTTQKIFESCVEASKFYNVHASNITMSCQGKILRAGILDDGRHLHWQYYSDYLEQQQVNRHTA